MPFLTFSKAFFTALQELPPGNWAEVGGWKYKSMTDGHSMF